MSSAHIPKRPVGHKPGKEFVDTGDAMGIKLGIVIRVDEINLKADVRVITGGGNRFEIDLTQGMCGPRSFWGGVPEVNSVVILGYRRKHKQLTEAMILGYIPTGNRLGFKFDPFSPVDPSTIDPADASLVKQIYGPTFRAKRLKLRPGDVGGMSAAGAEMVLSKDVRLYNRAGDMLELRDADRTWVGQSIHRVENESGVTRISGPIRRGAFYTYPDILQSAGQVNVNGTGTPAPVPAPKPGPVLPGVPTVQTLQTSAARYFGTPVYQASGPGFPGSANRYADANGNLLNVFNNAEFPSVTYNNGRQVYYTSTFPGVSMEDPLNGAGAEAFTEYRIELDHTSDLSQHVLEEIDGFAPNAKRKFIEHVLGTTVGNDAISSEGMRNYNRPTKPKMFDAFDAFSNDATFTMEECTRTPLEDMEVFTMAGAYLLAVHPPHVVSDDYFACAVSKQGKVFLTVPGSAFEQYADGAKNVSVEANFLGAIKANIGAATPSKQSINVNMAGGITANIGSNSDGRAIDVTYHSSVQASYTGTPDTDNVALTEDVQGMKQTFCSGNSTENVAGFKTTTVNGGYQIFADRLSIAGSSGVGISASDMSMTIAGKTQYNYALAVLENIVAGGKTVTVLAGALATQVAAGAITTTAGGGAMTDTVGANYTLSAGGTASITSGGALTMSAGGALTVSAAGAIAMSATAALTLTAGPAASIIGAQVLLGGPAAVFGIARGTPMMPAGAPSLDWVTGLPLQGCAVSRSF